MHLKLYKRDWGLAWFVQGSVLLLGTTGKRVTPEECELLVSAWLWPWKQQKPQSAISSYVFMSHPPVCTCYLDVSVKFFTGLSTVKEADSSVSNKGKSGWPESSVILQKEDTVKILELQERQRSQLKKE